MAFQQYFLVSIRDKDHKHLMTVQPQSGSEVTLRFNVASTAQIVVDDSHPVASLLTQDGSEGLRAAVFLIRTDGATVLKHRLVEGQVTSPEGTGPLGKVTIPVIDDWEWFSQILAYPNPALPIGAQDRAFAQYRGLSGDRALDAIRANATRLGLPWDVPSVSGLGTAGATDLRFEPLSTVAESLTLDRLQLSLVRPEGGTRWAVSIASGTVYSRPLTPESGLLHSWSWRRERSRYTRMVVGGTGNGVERELASMTDAARENAVGRIMEGFADANGAEAGANLTPYGTDALADAGPKASLSATLRESAWFRFPDAYQIGTRVKVQIGSVEVDDVITEIRVSQDDEGPITVTPKLGLADADPQAKLTKIIAGVATAVHGLERR